METVNSDNFTYKLKLLFELDYLFRDYPFTGMKSIEMNSSDYS